VIANLLKLKGQIYEGKIDKNILLSVFLNLCVYV